MKTKLLNLWEKLISSLWFVPALMVTAGAALAVASLYVGQWPVVQDWIAAQWLAYRDVDAARRILATIAGSMITVAGVVFSISIVALSVASSQFGPRVLRSFMRDRGNQIVFGTFIGTFLFCVIVLGGIHSNGRTTGWLSVMLGLLLTLVSMAVLIYFIHHISDSLQASRVAARIGTDLIKGIESLFPELPDAPLREPPDGLERNAAPVHAVSTGYVQAIAAEDLVELARDKDIVVRARYRPGQFVVAGGVLLDVTPADRCNEELAEELKDCFIIGAQRTSEQDVEFSVQQLVQVALRALSPSINDPLTAINCIDELTAGLSRAAQRANPPSYMCDEQDRPRLFVHATQFPSLVQAAFDQVRQAARRDVSVTIRLLECLELIAPFVHRAEDRAELHRQAEMILRGSAELPEPNDRRDVEGRYQQALREILKAKPAPDKSPASAPIPNPTTT